APPHGSGLDEAPALKENMSYVAGGRALRPVGSTSVRAAVERVQPVLSLHGHIHEGKGATRIGPTLVLNPGSSYEEGILQAAMIGSWLFLGYVPGKWQVLPAILIAGVFITFLVITYAGLISVMPRAGGDYVWQSRVLGGGIAFVLAVTGWWFILWYWAPIYAAILNVEVLQPLAAFLKWNGLLTFLGKDTGLFTICVI